MLKYTNIFELQLVIFMLMLHEELSTLLPGQWNGSDG
jgi:hypothetical protein